MFDLNDLPGTITISVKFSEDPAIIIFQLVLHELFLNP